MEFEADNIPIEKLPSPVGWRLMIAPVKVKETSKGGLVLVDESQKMLKYFRNIGKVLALGVECYQHEKFGSSPAWVKVGDIIQYNTYTGTELKIQHDGEEHTVRFINDDEVVSVISDTSILISL